MKQLLPLLLLISIAGACGKSSDNKSGSLKGKWRLTETMISPGNAVPWTAVDYTDGYVSFSANGKFTFNKIPYRTGLNKYRILDDKRVELYQDNSSNQPVIVFYQIEGSTLILNFPCIEACGYKFVRTGGNL